MTSLQKWDPLTKTATAQTSDGSVSDQDILEAIELLTEQYGYPPIETEIGSLVGLPAAGYGGVNGRLADLEMRGLIVRAHSASGRAITRTVRVVKNPPKLAGAQPEPKVDPVKVLQDEQRAEREQLAANGPPPTRPGFVQRLLGVTVAPPPPAPEPVPAPKPSYTVPPDNPAKGGWTTMSRAAVEPGGSRRPIVTRDKFDVLLYVNGHLRINNVIHDALGKPGWVRVFFNRDLMMLAVVPSQKGDPESVQVVPIKIKPLGLWTVALKKMFKHTGIDPNWYDAVQPHLLEVPPMPEELAGGLGVMLVRRSEYRISKRAKED